MTVNTIKTELNVKTNKRVSLGELSAHGKVMVVFLRHFGCTFCREAMADLCDRKKEIEAKGTTIVLVHQMHEDYARQIMEIYELENLHRISDPDLSLYNAFGLGRGNMRQIFGLRVWLRGFWAGIIKGHLVGSLRGDGWQMPGVFVIYKNRIIEAFRHEYASDKPNYLELASCELPQGI